MFPKISFYFATSISENIRFGHPNLGEEEIEEACEIVHVYDDIMDMPEKFDTVVGEKGIALSGGQKQRLGYGTRNDFKSRNPIVRWIPHQQLMPRRNMLLLKMSRRADEVKQPLSQPIVYRQ